MPSFEQIKMGELKKLPFLYKLLVILLVGAIILKKKGPEK
jgi:hypothetical protein